MGESLGECKGLLCQGIFERSHPQHNEGHPGHNHNPAGNRNVVKGEQSSMDGGHLP